MDEETYLEWDPLLQKYVRKPGQPKQRSARGAQWHGRKYTWEPQSFPVRVPKPKRPGQGPSRRDSKWTRRKVEEVAKRDGWLCWYCDVRLSYDGQGQRPTLDHVVPLSKGGTNRMENLRLACGPCNFEKGDTVE